MELLRKKQLLTLNDENPTSLLFRESITDYARALGSEDHEFYSSLNFLREVDDSLFVGVGAKKEELETIENANFFLYEIETQNFYWFHTASDAVKFIQKSNNSLLPPDADAFSLEADFLSLFRRYNLLRFQKFYWIQKSSFEVFDAEDVVSNPRFYCVTKNITFQTIDEAAHWLVSINKAKSFTTALKALKRHFEQGTKSCYGMSWELN